MNRTNYSQKDLEKLAFQRDVSIVGQFPAMHSKLFNLLRRPDGHRGVNLDDDSFERLARWIDVYAQRLGSFSEQQKQELRKFRRNIRSLLAE